MTTFLILIIVFILFINLPRIMHWLLARRMKREINNIFNTFGGAGSNSTDKAKKQQQPTPRRKKIDAEVGEYVHFEEIEVTVQAQTENNPDNTRSTTTKIKVEDQIIDVEWEDI